MSHARKYTYREVTPAPVWVLVVLWGALLAAYLGTDRTLGQMEGSAVLMGMASGSYLLVGVLFHVLFGKLTVALTQDTIDLWFGVGIIRKTVRLTDVSAVESVTYSPLMEFGGWGIRGLGKKKIWSMRGNRAVVVTLPEDAKFYIGSDTPERLRERIAAGIPRPPKDTA